MTEPLEARVAAAREREGWQEEAEGVVALDRATGALYTVMTRRADGSPAEVLEWDRRFWGEPCDPNAPVDLNAPEWFDVSGAWIWDRKPRRGVEAGGVDAERRLTEGE